MSQVEKLSANCSPPLTTLSPDELLFQQSVEAFAEAEVRPRVEEMEQAAHLDPALIRAAFELGLMGLEVDDQYGGSGGSLMMVTLAVEAISRIDASSSILVDVQNTLV